LKYKWWNKNEPVWLLLRPLAQCCYDHYVKHNEGMNINIPEAGNAQS